MHIQRLAPVALSLFTLVLGMHLSCAQADEAAMEAVLPELVTLTDKDVTQFIKAANELMRLGVELDGEPWDSSFADRLAGQGKAMDVLRSSGFTPERLHQVGYSVGMAMLVVSGDAAEMKQEMAQMEQMKSQMTPEQWAMASASMGPALTMMKQLDDQPPGNLAVVKKHQEALDKLMR
ncbi:MAG: hypothetical protein AAFX85_05235 [Pseudomonadota bacterium]